MFLSLTRLRLRRMRDLFRFLPLSQRCTGQAVADPACVAVAAYVGPGLTFWTATLWASESAMRAYLRTGAHAEAMPYLRDWCSEAATSQQDLDRLPTKAELVEFLAADPRFVPVREPSALQQSRVVPASTPWLRQVAKEPNRA